MQILMIRHGRTEWNEARRIQGRTDIPLNDRGRQEQSSRSIPADFANAPVWSSPLSRAIETARLLGAPSVLTSDKLIEMDFGTWEGRTHADLEAEDPTMMHHLESQGIDMRPPGGETPADVMLRLADFLISLSGPRQVLVCHKGVMRAAFAWALNWDMRADMPFKVDWTAGHLFRLTHDDLSLEAANIELSTS